MFLAIVRDLGCMKALLGEYLVGPMKSLIDFGRAGRSSFALEMEPCKTLFGASAAETIYERREVWL